MEAIGVGADRQFNRTIRASRPIQKVIIGISFLIFISSLALLFLGSENYRAVILYGFITIALMISSRQTKIEINTDSIKYIFGKITTELPFADIIEINTCRIKSRVFYYRTLNIISGNTDGCCINLRIKSFREKDIKSVINLILQKNEAIRIDQSVARIIQTDKKVSTRL